MTDEEINTTIAEVCGWTEIGKLDPLRGISPQWEGVTAYDGGKIDPPIWDIPDYCNDLNAMHKAEKVLVGKNNWELCEYVHKLHTATNSWIAFATARQRAEAFLRTLNLWTE